MRLKGFPYVKGKRVAILVHRQADVDAIASAIGLKKILEEKGFSVSVPEPHGVSSLAKAFMERVGFKFKGSIRGADVIVIVDTGNPKLLENYLEKVKGSKALKVLVDHHPYDPAFDFVNFKIVDTKASSTSEIVYRVLERNGIRINKYIARVLLAGILFDSQHLNIASCKTLGIVKKLCEIAGGLSQAKALLVQKKDISEVIARLKAGQRAKLFRAGEMVLVISRLSSFQSSAAKFFVDAGADFAGVLGETDSGTRGSFRCSKGFLDRTGLHLGKDLARKVAERYGGAGGGHPTAASFSANVNIGDAENYILEIVEEILGKLEELRK